MKKRNKKYNPKQIIKQKVHKFQMTWEVNEAKRIIELHHLMNGVDPQESIHTPLHVWMRAHKGDLALALKTQTIPAEQSYHIVSRIHAVNDETGEAVDVEFQLATATPMHLWQFLGDEEADIYVEDGGFKKKWLGFNHELEKYLNSIEGDYRIVTNHCCLTCFSSFKSFKHEMEFKSIKLINPELGLGVAA
ncbi:hypothetical protein [Acinetobacter sp. Ver3]|uniref:hypothetical protein n=1 Tax=Acinetobacter sp. Ver3 TaxID=466088 RepID=UPI00044E4F00|nr:hypothetical protein [Acinetobacter sp. Ver3]EZQ10756.1 hypothetical protein CL42_06410 [Acinetobacter sp. Ver3]